MLPVVLLILFFCLSAVHIIGEFLQDPVRVRIRTATKPLLLPLLAGWFYMNSEEPNLWILAGLVLGWVGDVVLMFPKITAMFLAGLASFLTGHALFIYAFLEAAGFLAGFPVWFILIGGLFAVLAAFFYLYFKPYLTGEHADKKGPVTVYALIIAGMSYTSLALFFANDPAGVTYIWMPFLGSWLFMASDFMLARQLFVKPFRYDQAFIMLTYLLAQYFIAQGFTAGIL